MQYFYYSSSGEKVFIGYDYDGWAFFLCVDRFPNLTEWKNKFADPSSCIKDSYNNDISPEEMEVIITMKIGSVEFSNNIIESYGPSVFKGSHTLVHVKIGCTVGTIRCVGNEDCWDLCLPRW